MTRRRTILFAASLLLNIFAIGAIGGGLFILARPGGLHMRSSAAPRPVVGAGAKLPPADRMRFDQTMREVVRDNHDLGRMARENRRLAADLFVQPSFDQEAVRAALDRARQADFALRGQLEAAAIGFAASLPPDERATLAEGLARGGPLREPGRKRRLNGRQ